MINVLDNGMWLRADDERKTLAVKTSPFRNQVNLCRNHFHTTFSGHILGFPKFILVGLVNWPKYR